MKTLLILLYCFGVLLQQAIANSCSFSSNGYKYDFSPLISHGDNHGTYMTPVKGHPEFTGFAFNPCSSADWPSSSSCASKECAMCLGPDWTKDIGECSGRLASQNITFRDGGVTLAYIYGDGGGCGCGGACPTEQGRSSYVKMMCDPTADTPVFVNTRVDMCNYYFTFTSKYACPISSPTPTPFTSIIDNCTYTSRNGSVYDFSPLVFQGPDHGTYATAVRGHPEFTGFNFNPCANAQWPTGTTCAENNCAMCLGPQWETDYGQCSGQLSTQTISESSAGIVLSYINGDGGGCGCGGGCPTTKGRSSYITMVCDPNAETPVFTNTLVNWCDYYFTFTSKYACATPPPTYLQLSFYAQNCSAPALSKISLLSGKCTNGFLVTYSPSDHTASLSFSFSDKCESPILLTTFDVGSCTYIRTFNAYVGVDIV